jgi:hypothetical protein
VRMASRMSRQILGARLRRARRALSARRPTPSRSRNGDLSLQPKLVSGCRRLWRSLSNRRRRRSAVSGSEIADAQDAREVADAQDVREVLNWAEANRRDRSFTVYAVVDKTLVRLSGEDPTVTE